MLQILQKNKRSCPNWKINHKSLLSDHNLRLAVLLKTSYI
jgi:hypothetical protein